jgi:MFS family permease
MDAAVPNPVEPVEPVEATATPVKSALLINRNFAILWSGQALSILGDTVFNTTLVIWIASFLARGQSWAPLAVTGILLAAYTPACIIGPFAGVFVDRLDKRRTMLVTDGLRALCVAVLILATGVIPLPFLPHERVPQFWALMAIYLIVFLVNTADQFFSSAMLALIGDLVPEATQPKAMGLRQTTVSLASMIGPALAAPLFITFGAQWALLINALSFVISFVTIATIRAPKVATSVIPGKRIGFAHELRDGLRFYVHSRMLMILLVAMVAAIMGAVSLETLNIFFTTENLHASMSLYGFMGTAFGVGAFVGAALAGAFAERLGVERILWLSLLLAGFAVVVLSRVTVFLPALALFALIGLCVTGVNVVLGPLLLRATPRELLGRVNSVLSAAMSASVLIATTLAGYLASEALHGLHVAVAGTIFGPVDTIYSGAGFLFIASAFVVMAGLRGGDRRAK